MGYPTNNNDDWKVYEKAVTYKYNEQGWLIEIVDSLSDAGPERWVYTWDEHGNQTTSKNYLLNQSGWYLIQADSFEFEYNDQGLLSKKIEHFAFSPQPEIISSFSTNYDYYCDGLPRSEIYENRRVLYEYTEGTICLDAIENLEMTIFPNPTTGYLLINTVLLQTGEVVVNLYDTFGRLVLRKQVDYRTESIELDVSELPNGIYMVNLRGSGKSKTRKLLLEK